MTKIEQLAKKIRIKVLKMSYFQKTAHLGSSLSCTDIISVIYGKFLKISKKNISNPFRNRFILSKGHAASTLYAAMYYNNLISKKQIDSFCKPGSFFEEHPSPKIKGIEAVTGSLGHGLSVGCGIALAGKLQKKKYKVFVLMSDGECNEGTVWESALFASAKKLENLIVFIDNNGFQATGRTSEILSINPLDKKFLYFGWHTQKINGNNLLSITNAIKKAQNSKKPSLIVANTIKGKGVSFMEDDNNWHYKSPNLKELNLAIKEILKK
ncbi:transketolase [Candidatus Pelagibacter sp.]|nr:transketolase [Candidatus Pelagibacter sp.]